MKRFLILFLAFCLISILLIACDRLGSDNNSQTSAQVTTPKDNDGDVSTTTAGNVLPPASSSAGQNVNPDGSTATTPELTVSPITTAPEQNATAAKPEDPAPEAPKPEQPEEPEHPEHPEEPQPQPPVQTDPPRTEPPQTQAPVTTSPQTTPGEIWTPDY